MARRLMSRVGGFVHDIDVVASLSDEPNNIRLLSDRSLYILQNLSLEDITFLSRYGEILEDGFYLPVVGGAPEQADVESAVDLIRRDLNSMGVEQLLECMCETNTALLEQAILAGSSAEAVSSDGEVSTGPDEQFPDQASYFDAKCNVANAIFDTILGMIDWLDDNDVDLLAGLFGGVTSGLLVGLALAGPVGWAWALAGALITSIAGYLVRLTVNFSDLSAALNDTHDECVLSLYNASNAAVAKTSFIDEVEAGTPAITSVESALLGMLLASDLTNNLFSPRDDITAYASPSPVDCGAALLQVWSFVASGEGWSFRDDSTGAYTAAGVWNSGAQAWRMTLTGPGTGTGPRAKGTILITGLSIAVPAGGSVQFDHSATSDSVVGSRRIKAIFSDVTEQEFTATSTATAGTAVMTLVAAKTIAELEISLGRNWSSPFTMTRDVEEVRVVGL
jgi:hypothetical protein